MKHCLSRALAVAAALTLTIVPAFAQLTFNGYYRVGGMVNAPDGGDTTAAFVDRIRLNIAFAAAEDLFGFKTRLEGNSSGSTSGLINLFSSTAKTTAVGVGTPAAATYTTTLTPLASLKYGQAYVKFLNGSLKLTAGKLDVTDYMMGENTGNIYLGMVATDAPALKGSLLGTQSGNTTGALLQAWPIEGLSVAGMMRTDGTEVKAHHFGLDASYLIHGLGRFIFASQFGSYNADDTKAFDDLDKSFASLGFSSVVLPGLTGTVAYRYNGYESVSKEAAHGAIAIVEYNFASVTQVPLWVNLSTDIDLTNSHLYLEGEATYTINPLFKVRAYGAYTDDSAANKNITITNSAGAKVINKTLFGADLVFPVGKSETMVGLVYGDGDNTGTSIIQVPVIVKVSF